MNFVKNINDCTPVEQVGGMFIKRDDKFRPFDNSVNGGKLRQCIALLDDKINGVVSISSIHSPQLAIIPAVAEHLNKECIMFIGGKKDTDMVRFAKKHNAKIIREKTGRHNVLLNRASKIAKEKNYFLVDYGMNAKNNLKAFYDTNANQVKNIPDELDDLMVTCGSGITATGIIYGLTKFKKKVKTLYLIGTAPNRMLKIRSRIKKLEENYGINIQMPKIIYDNLFVEKGFEYSRKKENRIDNIILHPNYEAKTFERYLLKYYNKSKKTLLWIVGGKIYA